MSNAESIPNPEEGREPSPEEARETPDGDAGSEPPAETPASAAQEPKPAEPAPAPAAQEPRPDEPAPAPTGPPRAERTQVLTAPVGAGPTGAPQMAASPHGPRWQQGAPAGPPPGYGHPGARMAPPRRGAGKLVAGAIALTLLAGGAGGVVGWALSDKESTTTVVESVSMDAGGGMTYTEIAEMVSPSVVAIVTDAAEGSGVVYSKDGYIVTNNHVVDGARSVEVRFSDGTVSEAEVIATDATQDLAVIQAADAADLSPVNFGDSDSLQVGDATVAIGSPLGLEGTVTTGIVSSLNRSMSLSNEDSQGFGQSSSQTLSGLIQTDAAINMGNSGGALVNGNGELIGINTAIASTESGSIGLGFAIPSNTVKDTVDQLIENGSVEQGYLGVSVSDTEGNGAMVLEVESGSPADEAGLQEGDVITAIDDSPISTAAEVVSVVQSKASGDDITITYTRDGEEQTADVTLTAR